MIALDTNIILHFLISSQREHRLVRDWFAQNQDPLATTTTNVAEVLRLLTHPKVFPKPMSLAPALSLLKSFVQSQAVAMLEEAGDWWEGLDGILAAIPTLCGNDVFDARIALCLKHNGVQKICTLDADFYKFKFLQTVMPTAL